MLLECRKHINYSETLQFQATDFQLKTLYLDFLATPSLLDLKLHKMFVSLEHHSCDLRAYLQGKSFTNVFR